MDIRGILFEMLTCIIMGITGIVAVSLFIKDKRNYLVGIVIVACILIIGYGLTTIPSITNPKIANEYLTYYGCTARGFLLGTTYTFSDGSQTFDLVVHRINSKDIIKGRDFEKGEKYYVTYETRSDVMLSIE